MGGAQRVTPHGGRDGRLDPVREIGAHAWIGVLYSVVTLHLGFDFNADEYKIMGLAPYGDAERFRPFFEKAIELLPDGMVRIPLLRMNKSRDERENYLATRKYLANHLIKPRDPDAEITGDHRDVAAALQDCLDRVMLHICGTVGRRTGLRRLALAGGVALNCTANGKLVESGMFDDIFVQPAAADDGSALGAAIFGSAQRSALRNVRMPVPC